MSEEKELVLDRNSYMRFLRAGGTPQLEWFLTLEDEEQEAMAEEGDAYQMDLIIAQAYAIQDPAAAALGEGSEEAEEEILGRMGAALLAGRAGEVSPLPPLGPEGGVRHGEGVQEHRPTGGKRDPLAGIRSPTMGGRCKRRAERRRQEREETSQAMSFCGKKADPAEAEE